MKDGLEKYFEEGQAPEDVQDVTAAPAAETPIEDANINEEQQVQAQEEEQVDVQEQVEDIQEKPILESVEEITDVIEEVGGVEELVAEAESLNVPEGLEKLVEFMNETGGSLEDYVALNRSFDEFNDKQLLTEYYKRTKSSLDQDDISYLINKKLKIDEEEMDEFEVRERKIALKEELGKAKNFLNDAKDKYYAELKAKSGGTSKEAEEAKLRQEALVRKFQTQTKEVFNEEFKGFNFDLGEGKKKIRYRVDNAGKLAETQSDITNVLGGFLNEEGLPKDPVAYHKALFAMQNADKIAQLFYEQGKADAIKESTKDSKNLDFSNTHQPPTSDTKLKPGQAREIESPTYKPRVQTRFTKW